MFCSFLDDLANFLLCEETFMDEVLEFRKRLVVNKAGMKGSVLVLDGIRLFPSLSS